MTYKLHHEETGRGSKLSFIAVVGTAAVCVAGILASLHVSKMKLSEHTFMFLGAGEVCL